MAQVNQDTFPNLQELKLILKTNRKNETIDSSAIETEEEQLAKFPTRQPFYPSMGISPRFFISILRENRQRFTCLFCPIRELHEQYFFATSSLLSSLPFLKIMGFPVAYTFEHSPQGGKTHEYPDQSLARNACVNKRTITIILVVYLTIIWAAVIFRIDYFPLTWVPMYSVYEPSETISVKVWDKDKYRKGLKVTYRDGSTGYVSSKDLNIPKPNFRRLYYSRMFGTAPPKHKQGNIELGTINQWVRGLDEDEPRFEVDWEWRMFWTLNKTLGHEPSDPKFIIRIEADHQKRVYRKKDLLRKDLINVQIDTRQALIEWRDEWLPRWKHGIL